MEWQQKACKHSPITVQPVCTERPCNNTVATESISTAILPHNRGSADTRVLPAQSNKHIAGTCCCQVAAANGMCMLATTACLQTVAAERLQEDGCHVEPRLQRANPLSAQARNTATCRNLELIPTQNKQKTSNGWQLDQMNTSLFWHICNVCMYHIPP